MIDEKFSATAFEKAGYGSEDARHLCKQLQKAIQDELDVVIHPAMLEVILKLNGLGHNLFPVGKLLPGDKQFQEPLAGNQQHEYKLIVALDVVISIGYPHTVDYSPE